MRARLIVAIATVILVGAGAKTVFFSGPIAEANADAVKSGNLDVARMQVNTAPVSREYSDMTFVFSHGD
jgi:hypothetical protein